MKYSLKHIAEIVGGEFCGEDIVCCDVSHDSRTIFYGEGVLFVALSAGRYDGHFYLTDAYKSGVRAFMVSKEFENYSSFPLSGFVVVDDTLKALQTLAAHHRHSYKGNLLAITGSNGKTIVKEWISQLYAGENGLFRSPKSYNSQIGVALSLLMIQGDEKLVIIEAGISQIGEMQRLERMIKPTHVLLTCIGDAHGENFSSREEKLAEKLKLAKEANLLIYHKQCEAANYIEQNFPKEKLYGWSYNEFNIESPFHDEASKENIFHAVAALCSFNILPDNLNARVKILQRTPMRLELRRAINNSEIINDSYNSDYGSLQVALNYMQTIADGRQRIVILSDILQSGEDREQLYRKVALLLSRGTIHKVIAIGSDISSCQSLFSSLNCNFYLSTAEFLFSIDTSEFINAIILLKGSRRFAFEKIQRVLEQKLHNTILEVNIDNLLHNLSYYRSKTEKNVKFVAMVKALSYGSGSWEIARALEAAHIDYLAVAYTDEGIELREKGIKTPIIVLGSDPFSHRAMIENRLEPEIYSIDSLKDFARECASSSVRSYPIHIKLDTGMHRLGFCEDDIDELINELKRLPEVKVKSIFSHLVGSDNNKFKDFTVTQIELFDKLSTKITLSFPYKILRHICNSAAIESYPSAHFDMVRLGIGLYGFG
ncbi:MAG: alanine racemase, partial [Rikenellaceae bacterium]